MKALDYVLKSGVLTEDQQKKQDTLKLVFDLFEKNYGVGEILFHPSVWAQKDFNFWYVDKLEGLYRDYLKFCDKKERYLKDLETRKEQPEGAVEEISKTETLLQLEEAFRPYKRKKKTKATLAREAGLLAFAEEIQKKADAGETFENGLESEAKKYIQPALGFITYETVLKGAKDIIVEQGIESHPDLREKLLEEILKTAQVVVKPGDKFKEGGKYSNFLKAAPQKCAFYLNPKNFDKFPQIKKAWEDSFLKVTLSFDSQASENTFTEKFKSKSSGDLDSFLSSCAKKAFEIHVLPSVTTEVFDRFYAVSQEFYLSKLKTDYMSLLATPCFGDKAVLSIYEKTDGNAAAVFVSHSGDFVSSTQIDFSKDEVVETLKTLIDSIVKKVSLSAIVLSLSPSCRKYEKLISKALQELKKEDLPVIYSDPRGLAQFVNQTEAKFGLDEKRDNESLASFYLARRAQNPLREYAQHRPSELLDVPAFMDKDHVDQELLKVLNYYVAMLGLEPQSLSLGELKNIGWFKEEGEDLAVKVQKLRDLKAQDKKSLEAVLTPEEMERFSKFFKFPDAVSLLDRSRVSQIDFAKLKDFFKDLEISLLKGPLADLRNKKDEKWTSLLGEDFSNYLTYELAHPFKDFRKPYRVFSFSKESEDVETLEEGRFYWALVTKFSTFGAFVNVGAGVDGLIHLSELSNEFISDPRRVLRLGQWVLVKAIKVDKESKKLSFSKVQAEKTARPKREQNKSKSFRDKKFKPKGKNFKDKRRKDFKPSKPKTPFNNPFAALGDLTKD